MNRQESNHTPAARERSARGFSLIELLVVVAVILIIAAIAIPNYIQSKMRANEASAAQSLRNIATAELVYASTYGISYTDNLPKLSGNGVNPDVNAAGLIDEVLASGIKQGYSITYTQGNTDSSGHTITFSVTADPLVPGTTGQRHFYTDQTAVIRSHIGGAAGPGDPAIQ